MESLKKYEKNNTARVVILLLVSVFFAIILERVYTYAHDIYINTSVLSPADYGLLNSLTSFSMMSVYRIVLLFCILFFILIHFIVKVPVLYDNIFKYRYVIAVLVFLTLVAGKINFSSVGMYDYIIQPGQGSEFTTPIFGRPGEIRSDEWIIATPIKLAAQYDPDPYGRYNYIVRGTETENMPFGMNINISALAFPLNLFFLLGAEYGISAQWVGTLIISFMVTFELMYIISGKKRLLALAGACLVVFSPFFQWWSYIVFITTGIGTLVCFYYFLRAEKKIHRLLFSLGIVMFFSQFAVNLYPAWQVPAGYLYLGLAAWIVVENWEKVKKLDKTDWGIFGLMLVLIAAVIGTYLWDIREYTAGISGTVYPGARFESGGGSFSYNLNRMMNGGIYAPISAFRAFAGTNICEFGGFYTLFPIPALFLTYTMIRKRSFDLLNVILVVITMILGTYVFFGWPEWLARFTLMFYSPSSRALDVMLFVQIFLLVRVMSMYTERDVDEKNNNRLRAGISAAAVAAGLCLTFIAVYFNSTTFIVPINLLYFTVPFAGIVVISYSIFDNQRNRLVLKTACIYMISLSCIIWMTSHPVMKGLDAIYSKPLAAKITELADDTDEKWVSSHSSIIGPAFLIANGASTLNTTNFYPNLEMWFKLDPDRQFEEIYNRYTHIPLVLTNEKTSFELLHADQVQINLSYNDLALLDVKFIHSLNPLEDFEDVRLTLLYEESGSYIYSVN